MPAGQAYTPAKAGYFLSKELLIRLLERLEDLQHQLDTLPKADTLRYGEPAKLGQVSDDSARPSELMDNGFGGDNHDPQVRYQAETVGKPELSIGSGEATRAAGLHDLDSHIGFPSGPDK